MKPLGVYRHLCSGALFIAACYSSVAAAECRLTNDFVFDHAEIGSIQVFHDTSSNAVAFASQMQVNTDGAPDSYHPDDIGITHICNGISVGPECAWKEQCLPEFRQAKAEGFRGPTKICFFAMATDGNGVPIIQGGGDPKPGFFVSTTALHQPGENPRSPLAQLDSNTVPFAVIPTTWQRKGQPGPKLGDTGPRNKLGEGSVALHQALGNDPFQTRYGVRRARQGIGGRDVLYLMFPNTV